MRKKGQDALKVALILRSAGNTPDDAAGVYAVNINVSGR
jgi:hypothetical protein